jgi:uncharacterized protein YjbI with pentapeptide repeats
MTTKSDHPNKEQAKSKNAYENFVAQLKGLGEFVRNYWITIAVIIGLIAIAAFGLRAHFGHWLWLGFTPSETITSDNAIQYYPGKTLWDVLDLVIVPLTLAVVVYFFNRRQRQTELDIAAESERDRTLQKYLDAMKELLLDKKLLTTEDEALKNIAKTLTLVTIRHRLDGVRNGIVIRFLVESGIIKRNEQHKNIGVLDLGQMDLSGVDLNNADLSRLDLRNMKAREADFRKANFQYTDLRGAELIKADLSEAYLWGTNLDSTNMYGANLCGADLWGAKIKTTTNFIAINFDKATIWPTEFDPYTAQKPKYRPWSS